MKPLKLTATEIENKTFNVEFKGYSPLEVDTYLDTILQDYDAFSSIVDQLTQKIDHYQRIIDDLSAQNKRLEAQLTRASENSTSGSSVDLIRRVARLEEAVFNQRIG